MQQISVCCASLRYVKGSLLREFYMFQYAHNLLLVSVGYEVQAFFVQCYL